MTSELLQFTYFAIACGTWLWLQATYATGPIYYGQQFLILLGAILWPATAIIILAKLATKLDSENQK